MPDLGLSESSGSEITHPPGLVVVWVREQVIILHGPGSIHIVKGLNIVTRGRVLEPVLVSVVFVHVFNKSIQTSVVDKGVHVSEVHAEVDEEVVGGIDVHLFVFEEVNKHVGNIRHVIGV